MTGSISTTPGTAALWNGPICPTCHARYLGTHVCPGRACAGCDAKDAAIAELVKALAGPRLTESPAPQRTGFDPSLCPCNPARGGSGICGCINGGPQITC